MTTNVLILIDHVDSRLTRTSLELATLARSLGSVSAVWPGEAEVPEDELATYGIDRVYRAANAGSLAAVSGAPVAVAALVDAARAASGARLILASESFDNADILTRVCAPLGWGMVANADTVGLNDGELLARRSVFASTWVVESATSLPAGATVGVGSCEPERTEPRDIAVIDLEVSWPRAANAIRVLSDAAAAGEAGGPTLSEADVVVVAGRGTEGNIEPLNELAALLRGAVGGTRVASDEGWVERAAQVGQTGVSIAPCLYIGAGVSGAIHHTGGMSGAKNVVAINTDPDAPIFEIADFGIVGDVAEVVPQLIQELRTRLGR